jgi:hypothetical protein
MINLLIALGALCGALAGSWGAARWVWKPRLQIAHERIARYAEELQEHANREAYTIYALRAEVELVNQREIDPTVPEEMTWRWVVWPVTTPERPREHPLMLGNTATKPEAWRAAVQWVVDQRQRARDRELSV